MTTCRSVNTSRMTRFASGESAVTSTLSCVSSTEQASEGMRNMKPEIETKVWRKTDRGNTGQVAVKRDARADGEVKTMYKARLCLYCTRVSKASAMLLVTEICGFLWTQNVPK